jgi:hypothetical protein
MSWRTPVTLVVLLGLVIGAAWYGWQLFDKPYVDPFAERERSCVGERLKKGDQLRTRQVTINVYNDNGREGLASDTLAQLRRRGFRPGDAANAPRRASARRVAIYDAEPRSAAVRLVAAQFRGQVRTVKRPNIGSGVDVVVGSGYRGLARQAPKAVVVKATERICVPRRSPT